MSFDYDRIKQHNDHASWWTSYADLFMMLSIVFLLMFVASSLRSGSAGFQQQQEFQKMSQHVQDLEEQIRVYNTLKDDALKKQNSAAEQEVYQKLMGKLDLLKEEAHDEKVALEKKARENSEKEYALSQYQQIVRNIINANVLAKSQIQHRDQMIVSKDMTIAEKRQKIDEMEKIISKNDREISDINEELADRIAALKNEQQRSKTSKAILEKKIAKLREDSSAKISELEGTNKGINLELRQVKGTLQETQSQLGQANVTIQNQQAEVGSLAQQLQADKARYVAEINALKKGHEQQMANEKAAFEAKLKKQRLGAAARAQKMAQFMKAEKAKGDALNNHLNDLRAKVADTEAKLASTQNQLSGTRAEADRALASVENLKGDLARTQEIANARKKLAAQISQQFAKAGLKGAVDGRTGEVTLDFGGEYFDTGSTDLKPKMRTTLDQFMPVYARSLFSDPKIADKIASVEIVGFASSTYKGRYVNPKSTQQTDKEAIDYNLRLSFGRANSIFKHVLNQHNLSNVDRDQLMPLLKVVGRGYLPEGKTEADLPDTMTEREFCAKYNCQKAQKVIVKFNMKD